MTRRWLSSFVLASLCAVPSSAWAANILVISNSGQDFVAMDFTANTSHTFDSFDANATPTLDELMAYDAVLLFENGTFPNAVNVGDVLAEYVLAGGGVVLGTFYWQNRSDAGFGGSWGDLELYDPMTAGAGGCEYNSDDMDQATIVDHPIMAGVMSLHGNSFRGGTTAKPESEVLALWSTPNNLGEPDPVVALRYEGESCVIGVTMFPDASFNDFTGDFYVVFDNALSFAADCAPPGPCGNGLTEPEFGEACDDGNYSSTDACVHCQPAACGDGHTYAGVEPCDDGNDGDQTDNCLDGCIAASCGDGYVHTGVEPCDDGNDGDQTDECLDGCVAASCGDGFLWAGVESCDDGDFDNSDDCPLSCQPAVCGDGYVQAGVEPCDDGNDVNDDACLVGCIAPSCGDGYVNAGVEACDDGNTDDSDICVGDDCQLAACGDGFLHTGVEDCDDGNDIDDDGCTHCNIDASGSSSGAEGSSSGGGGSDSGSSGEGGSSGGTAADTTGTTAADSGSSDGGSASVGDTDGSTTIDTSNDGESSSGLGDTDSNLDDDGGCACTSAPRPGRDALAPVSLLLACAWRRRRRAR